MYSDKFNCSWKPVILSFRDLSLNYKVIVYSLFLFPLSIPLSKNLSPTDGTIGLKRALCRRDGTGQDRTGQPTDELRLSTRCRASTVNEAATVNGEWSTASKPPRTPCDGGSYIGVERTYAWPTTLFQLISQLKAGRRLGPAWWGWRQGVDRATSRCLSTSLRRWRWDGRLWHRRWQRSNVSNVRDISLPVFA